LGVLVPVLAFTLLLSCDDPADVAAEFSEASDSAAVEVDEGTTVNGTSSC